MSLRSIKRNLYLFRKTIILILTPLIFCPLLILAEKEYFERSACAYTILLMAVYWVSEVVPLAVTALLPLVLYPLLGVLPASVVSVQYLKDINILFLGGLTVAVAVENWNLHKRIALKVLTFVGAKPRWLLFGFMVTTAFLSMWISNVATTAMMIPIAQAVLTEMEEDSERKEDSSDSGCNTPEEIVVDAPERKRYSTTIEETPLGAEMGNIGDAAELGKRLASHDINDVPTWAQSETTKRYSNGAKYDLVGNHTNMMLTVPTPGSDEGPDTSTTLLVPDQQQNNMNADIEKLDYSSKPKHKTNEGMCKALTICICYAANIGGTATLTGTGPNLIMAGQFKTTYKEAPEVDFGSWAMYAFPGMVLFLLFAWLWLQYLFLDMGFKDLFTCCCKKHAKTPEEISAENVIYRQYRDLGPMSFAEISVLVLFILLALLWLTRAPGFVNGWGSLYIFKEKYVTDATVAMLITFILFVFPSKRPNMYCFQPYGSEEKGPVPPLLTWAVVQQKMAWNVILLLGGGFAMALGSKTSGLSAWIGSKLEPLSEIPPFGATFICCFVICALTQCTSNTATATVFIPILAELAEVLHVNPLYLMLPATVTTSYAFMLPVSTPPNAIAYSYGHLKMKDMIKAGSLLNLVGIVIVVSSIYIMGGPAFDVFDICPKWLHSPYCIGLRNMTMNNSTLLSTIAPNITSLGS
uniref:solute carrier family 13 member 5-like n=1 Tax=Styela clava TaxID=7725 RepID=UPI00193A3C34|nr:solute carrier family 13 member 5-like [Styela clava]